MSNKLSLICILVLFATSQVSAHSGRTDKNGGHNCSQKSKEKGLCTGYHYHNGGGLHFDETDELITAENLHLLLHQDDSRRDKQGETYHLHHSKSANLPNEKQGTTKLMGVDLEA